MGEAVYFKEGDRVQKSNGYLWPGVILTVFKTLAGETRVVVECTVPEVAGALHIYAPRQLHLTNQPPEMELLETID